jgi:hypothetical protein
MQPEMTAQSRDRSRVLRWTGKPAWAEVWHLWTVVVPRRTITGRLVLGKVWRRRDGRHWITRNLSSMTTWAVEPNGLNPRHIIVPGLHARSPNLKAAGGLPLPPGFLDQGNKLSAQIIKASASAAAIATSVGLIFALSWVGLALLGY